MSRALVSRRVTRRVALLAFLASATGARAQEPAEPQYVYFDYVEHDGGPLRGGRIPVDSTNRFHVPIGEATREARLPFETLVDNGPPENRIDLVFVGDGYTAGQLGTYAGHVNNVYPAFFAQQPLAEYASFFNVHRVDVTSNESGVDNDPLGVLRDTAMDMSYWCNGTDRLLCIDLFKAINRANSAPDWDQILALANSSTYGGAGYPTANVGTLAGQNSAAIEVALHEFGHAAGNLADEYDYGGPTTYSGPEPSEPNASKLTEASQISQQRKWYRWLDLPNVAAFEGAVYSQRGVYRPTFNSKMRNLDRPFEQVNTEALVLAFYEIVDPIDDATPADACDPNGVYSVTPVHPTGHPLAISWELDGVPIDGATGSSLDASTLGLAPGAHTLSVRVVDTTPLVRDEAKRAQLMTETRSWRLGLAAVVSANPGGTNPTSYTVGGSHGGRPVLGGTLDLFVDLSGTTGHSAATILGFLSASTSVLGTGQVLLVNVADPNGELLGQPLTFGDLSLVGVPLTSDPSFCGLTLHTQALHLLGVRPFALSNRQTLVFGYE